MLMKQILTFLFLTNAFFVLSNNPVNLYEHEPSESFDNIYSKMLFGDNELVNSFIIYINESVPEHFHQFHSEHVLIIEGSGIFKIDNELFHAKAGDLFFLPKKVSHGFTVTEGPVKALSIQAPYFDGTDRILTE
ncbi:MAG: cupin domain-containing protein [Chitinophagaceae bacterium]|nr:MAG: cupin domain-containing protein [Chitinophagaceae bacterium]